MPPHRIEFTKEHDNYLVKYLARHNPIKEGRSGNKLFERLVAEENRGQWPWAVHHSWQSWRERYVKNAGHFDKLILNYQRKHDIKPGLKTDKRKRVADPRPIEMLEPNAKRAKLLREEEEESSSSESRVATQLEKAEGSKSAKPLPKHPCKPPETPSQTQKSTQPTSIRHTVPVTSPPRPHADGSTSATKKPVPQPATQTGDEDDLFEILPPSPDRHPPFRTAPRNPPCHVKRTKVRLSDEFASEPLSPEVDTAAQGSSSQVQPVPSTPSKGADRATVTTVYPRAPPRVVDSFHGQVLVNRQGHVPRPFPSGERDGFGVEEMEESSEAQWPPARDRTTKQRRTSGPDVEVQVHHPFSQLPSQPEVPRDSERAQIRRTVAAQFTGRTHPAQPPQAENERRESGSSPVKCVVTAAPPSDPFAGQIPKHFSKVFPAPRPSTRSPFRPESRAAGTRRPSPPEPRPRPPSRTRAAHNLALIRVRRQTIANGNGHERDHRRNVPSIDLVALSHSSMSGSGSRSSTTSVPARPPRWSLPAFAHATPWAFDEPLPVYGDLWHGQKRTSSLVGTSTPRFVLTPSPARSVTNTTAPAHPNNLPAHPSPPTRMPHPPDLQLAASHGLRLILAQMSANHGLALGVVDAVYERVGSLREADEVLKVMREAAEGSGEREIERRIGRVGGRGEGIVVRRGGSSGNGRTGLRYVVASEDGEGSEYSPPETSRAAMWKRQSESASYGEEETREEEEEEAEEGREVEEELRDWDESEDEHHAFSRLVPLDDEMPNQDRQGEDSWDGRVTKALLEETKHAHQLEMRLGKARYRKDVVAKHFK